MAISTSSVAVAEECSALNKRNQIYWRLVVHNKLNDEKQSKWIKEEKYRDSIINVIGKAIGDCMARENEFKCSDRREQGKKVIIFEDEKKYKHPYDYTISNWNAVFLYNAVNLAINGDNGDSYLNTEELMQKCYERIQSHFFKKFDISYISDTKKEKLKQCLQQLKEHIMKYLEDKYKRIEKFVKENKKLRDVTTDELQLNDIEQLQKALRNFFDENVQDGTWNLCYKEAKNKLKQATNRRSFTSGLASYKEAAVDGDMYSEISTYLSLQLKAIATARLPKFFKKAKSDMIKYSEALCLDQLLDSYRSTSNTGGPGMQTKAEKFKGNGSVFRIFQYNVAMDLDVCKIGMCGSFPVFQVTGYRPCFLQWNNEISIRNIKKIQFTRSQNFFYRPKFEELETYGRDNLNECRELLDLLQDLVSPANTL